MDFFFILGKLSSIKDPSSMNESGSKSNQIFFYEYLTELKCYQRRAIRLAVEVPLCIYFDQNQFNLFEKVELIKWKLI